MNDKESGFAEKSLDNEHGLEAGKSGGSSKKKRVKKPPSTNEHFSSMEYCNPVKDSPAKHFEGESGLSFKHGTEVISSKRCQNLDLGEASVNNNESGFSPQPLDNDDVLNAGKSSGGQNKKGAKKHVNSPCDSPAKRLANEAQGNQSTLSCTEGKETSKEKSRNVSSSSASKGNKAGINKEIDSPLAEPDQPREKAKDLNENLREAKNIKCMETNALQYQPAKVQSNEVQHLRQDQAYFPSSPPFGIP